ncbi:MAG: Xaa-Pro dipeptidyl-peptidase [Planctomycetota bacterium]|nr:Xaa-Pro dipeptidyl-peptidase [Planctomycetota bacterium]
MKTISFLTGVAFLFTGPLVLSSQDQETPKNDKTLPVFKDGQSQIVEGFKNSKEWIIHELWVETEFDSDGDQKMDRVHVSVTRQKQTETEGLKVPVVYVSSPYFAGVSSSDRKYFWNPAQELNAEPPERTNPPTIKPKSTSPSISRSHIRTWVPRGFAVVHSEAPGTGLSQGCPTVGDDPEALAPKAVIDWLCGRAKGFTSVDGDTTVQANWCTGKIGMTGTSYNGTIPLAAATTGVKGLEAIIPIAPNTSYYHYYRSHGLVRHPGGWIGEDIDVLYDFIHSGNPERREYCDCEIRDKIMLGGFDRVNGDYNEFWKKRDYLNRLEPLKAATLMAHAFNDWNVMPEHSVRIYEVLKAKGVPCQAYFHQGGHGGEPPHSMMNRWFTRYLYGVQNGVEKDPRSWIVREDDKRLEPTPYQQYPHPEAKPVTFHLTKPSENNGTLLLEHKKNQGIGKIQDDASINGYTLAEEKSSPHRLMFVTPKFTKPVHISGKAKIKIKVASSKPAANLSVWLVSLPWDGNSRKITDNLITRGWADPQNHKSIHESEPLIPGNFYELSFDLQPDDQVIPAGQQIGLMIFSSDHDFTLWPKPGTELSVNIDATSLSIPIVGGKATYREATQ